MNSGGKAVNSRIDLFLYFVGISLHQALQFLIVLLRFGESGAVLDRGPVLSGPFLICLAAGTESLRLLLCLCCDTVSVRCLDIIVRFLNPGIEVGPGRYEDHNDYDRVKPRTPLCCFARATGRTIREAATPNLPTAPAAKRIRSEIDKVAITTFCSVHCVNLHGRSRAGATCINCRAFWEVFVNKI